MHESATGEEGSGGRGRRGGEGVYSHLRALSVRVCAGRSGEILRDFSKLKKCVGMRKKTERE